MPPDKARSEAKKLLGVVATGADPIEVWREARAGRTFGEGAEDFMLQHVAAKRKSRTEASYREVLEKHVYRPLTGAPKSHLTPSRFGNNILILLVPQEGFEPPTPSLRMRCSTS